MIMIIESDDQPHDRELGNITGWRQVGYVDEEFLIILIMCVRMPFS